MRLHAPLFVMGLISLAARVRCVSQPSDLFSPSASEEGPTNDILASRNLDDWTSTTLPGKAPLELSDDIFTDDHPLESDFLASNPGDEIVQNGGGGDSSCVQPLGRRDIAKDDLPLSESCINPDLPASDYSNLDIDKTFSEFINTQNDGKVKDKDPITDFLAPLIPYMLMTPGWGCADQRFPVCCFFGSILPPHNCKFYDGFCRQEPWGFCCIGIQKLYADPLYVNEGINCILTTFKGKPE